MTDISSQSELSSGSKQAVPGNDATEVRVIDTQFDELCQHYYRSWFRYHPEEAVAAGCYDYAGQLRSYEHDDIGALIALNQKMLSALEELSFPQLEQGRKIDYQLLKGSISIELHDLEENDWRYRDPQVYLPVNAIYQLLIHPGGDFHQAFKSRLMQTEQYLRGARMMLLTYPERVVPEWAETSIDIAKSAARFITELCKHPGISAKFTNPVILQPLLDAAAHAIHEYGCFLESDILPRAKGKFASGHYRFNRILKYRHFLDCNDTGLLELGLRLVEETESALLECSEKVCDERDIKHALEKIRSHHPAKDDVLSVYRKKMKQAYEWLQLADIVTLPEHQSLKVMETPVFMKDVIPFAAYEPPPPCDPKQLGLFYVTVADSEQQLKEHNDASIDLASVHEAFPGHHMQFVLANRSNANNPVRLLNDSATLSEGWALYCEQLAYEQGYYDNPVHEFMVLKDRLWRALRVVIDVKLHTGQMTFQQAVDLLREKLGFDDVQAQAEIAWYCSAATVPLCYAVGYEIIMKLRDIYFDGETPDRHQLKDFHDRLLSRGSIALPVVIRNVFGEQIWQKLETQLFQ